MVTHQRQRQQHLTCEPANQCCRETDKSIGLDQLIKIDAQQLHGYAQMISEIEVLCHLDDMVLFIRILRKNEFSTGKTKDAGDLPICEGYQGF